MSLNCLTCPTMQRTDSDGNTRYEPYKPPMILCCPKISRNWSGNLAPPPYEEMRSGPFAKKAKKSHRHLRSTNDAMLEGAFMEEENTEPRLVRSCGMRRDWSFEDLRQRKGDSRCWARKY
ncbi:uncharacterized protein LOC131163351 [Malania oleifera]|uniref:uncharacterized protein LOC131163351 n=1 Tax=Malania oleifera TaxID=397392 RepID=UPI0025ADF9E6|nr:uncharacterized protein LOC131163351 [Malania oleifera]